MARNTWRSFQKQREQVERLVTVTMPEASPAEIYACVDVNEDDKPSLGTVERWIKAARPQGPDWVASEATAEDFKKVARVLRWVRENTKKRWLTQGEAEKIAWIASIAPDMPEGRMWTLARLYLVYANTGRSVRELDEYMVRAATGAASEPEQPSPAFRVPEGRPISTARLTELTELGKET